MKIQFDAGGTGQNFIHAYGPGQVTINQQAHRRSLLVTPSRLITDWPPQSFSDLLERHFDQIRELDPEVVVLGTGARLQFPRTADTRALIQANIGLEVMDTGAACRTYNILMQDGRRVAAALLMIES
ncbi:MAG: Mth938-like domain-containing protein [Pseudomonadota bacterium]